MRGAATAADPERASGSPASVHATAAAARLAASLEAELIVAHLAPPRALRVDRLTPTIAFTRRLDDPYSSPVLLEARVQRRARPDRPDGWRHGPGTPVGLARVGCRFARDWRACFKGLAGDDRADATPTPTAGSLPGHGGTDRLSGTRRADHHATVCDMSGLSTALARRGLLRTSGPAVSERAPSRHAHDSRSRGLARC